MKITVAFACHLCRDVAYEELPTRYPNDFWEVSLSRYFNDPKEAAEAMKLAKGVIELAEKKIMERE